MRSSNYTPTVLTIAGSDNYGGAGVQIDSKTIHGLGGYALSAITALTAQNSQGVIAIEPTSPYIFKAQLDSILSDIKVDAVKIGMLVNADTISIVAQAIDNYKLSNIILDPVLVSTSGKTLLDESAIKMMADELFPRVTLITPNIPEVNKLLDKQYTTSKTKVLAMASGLMNLGANSTLIKGGHSLEKYTSTDYFIDKDMHLEAFVTPRLKTTHTHGTGCMLSSAIATHLAKGYTLTHSIELSKNFLYKSMKNSSSLNLRYIDTSRDIKEPIM